MEMDPQLGAGDYDDEPNPGLETTIGLIVGGIGTYKYFEKKDEKKTYDTWLSSYNSINKKLTEYSGPHNTSQYVALVEKKEQISKAMPTYKETYMDTSGFLFPILLVGSVIQLYVFRKEIFG